MMGIETIVVYAVILPMGVILWLGVIAFVIWACAEPVTDLVASIKRWMNQRKN